MSKKSDEAKHLDGVLKRGFRFETQKNLYEELESHFDK